MKNKSFLTRLVCGFFIGFGFIVPGVSGSAIAMTFDIYNQMVDSVSNVLKDFKNSFLFLLPIGLGVIISAISLYFPLTYLLKQNCFIIIMLFAGLLAGSIKLVVKKANWKTKKVVEILVFSLAFLSVIGISLISYFVKDYGVNLLKPKLINYIMVFVSGVLFACSIVIPGVSGTALLLAIGYYYPIIKTLFGEIISFNLSLTNVLLIITFILGVVIGVFVISKVIKKCFDKHEKSTYMAISGFAIGSLPAMFISQDWGKKTYNEVYIKLPLSSLTVIFGVILLVCGFIVSYYLMDYKEKKLLKSDKNENS